VKYTTASEQIIRGVLGDLQARAESGLLQSGYGSVLFVCSTVPPGFDKYHQQHFRSTNTDLAKFVEERWSECLAQILHAFSAEPNAQDIMRSQQFASRFPNQQVSTEDLSTQLKIRRLKHLSSQGFMNQFKACVEKPYHDNDIEWFSPLQLQIIDGVNYNEFTKLCFSVVTHLADDYQLSVSLVPTAPAPAARDTYEQNQLYFPVLCYRFIWVRKQK